MDDLKKKLDAASKEELLRYLSTARWLHVLFSIIAITLILISLEFPTLMVTIPTFLLVILLALMDSEITGIRVYTKERLKDK